MSAYTGWLLPDEERERLLKLFPPHYPDVIAHHVTLDFGVPDDTPLPPQVEAEVVGVADDASGVQALVVSIDGKLGRPDGSIFHITWSIDREKGRKPVHSNEVVRHGWTFDGALISEKLSVKLEPKVFAAEPKKPPVEPNFIADKVG